MDNKKFLLILGGSVLAVFLGAFFAFWAIFGNIQKHNQLVFLDKNIIPTAIAETEDSFPDIDKMIERQQKLFDKINKDFDEFKDNSFDHPSYIFMGNNRINNDSSASVKTEELKDSYKITVDLKPFNNDAKNVEIKVKDKTVLISAKFQSKDKHEFSSSSFYQSLMLPAKLDVKDIKQQKEGDSLVITIPKKLEQKV